MASSNGWVFASWNFTSSGMPQDYFYAWSFNNLHYCTTLNLWKMWLLNNATHWSGKLLWKEKTSESKRNIPGTNCSSMNLLLCNSTNNNTSNLVKTFSYRPPHRKSINCNVTSMSQAEITRDLIQVRPPTYRGKSVRGGEGRRKINVPARGWRLYISILNAFFPNYVNPDQS